MITGFAAKRGVPGSLFQMLNSLGLASGLKICLDAGDRLSYDSGNKWLDRSGGGYDLFFGMTGSGSDTPTFHGVSNGLSANEYMLFDGGDCFNYDSAVEPWMQNLVTTGGLFTGLMWLQLTSSATQPIFTTASLGGSTNGIVISRVTSSGLFFDYTSSGAQYNRTLFTSSPALNTWLFLGWGVDTATRNTFTYVNGSYSTAQPTTASVSTQMGTRFLFGKYANGAAFLANGSKIAQFAILTGVNFSQSQLDAIWNTSKGRYGY